MISILAVLNSAHALEEPWYLSRIVDGISVVNDEGSVPQGDLHTLLATQVGEELALDKVRSDLTMLYTMGSFAKLMDFE